MKIQRINLADSSERPGPRSEQLPARATAAAAAATAPARATAAVDETADKCMFYRKHR